MSVLDVALLAVAALAAVRGWRLGLTGFGFSLAGLLVGVLAGAWASGWFGTSTGSPLTRLLLEAGCVLAGALIGSALGGRLGAVAGRALSVLHLRLPDRVAGAGARGALALGLCWALGAVLAAVGPPAAADAVTGSAVLSAMSGALPAPSRIARNLLTRVAAAPSDLIALIPASNLTTGQPSPAQVQSAAAAAAGAVVKITATGCPTAVEGSGFVTSGALVVTNAPVVAGATTLTLTEPQTGRAYRATAVLVDGSADLAFLDVPRLDTPRLPLATGPAGNGSPAVAVGYPGDGPLTATPAVVTQRLPVLLPRTTTSGLAIHEVYRLAAQVRPGNSGGPLLNTAGHVIGVVNAHSLTDPATGYALTLDPLHADLAIAAHRSSSALPASTGTCAQPPPFIAPASMATPPALNLKRH